MDTKPLTVDAPTYPQLEKLIEERVRSLATERGIGADILQSALGFPGTGLETGIVHLIVKFHNARLFGEQIKAGGFDYLYGFAEHPEQIEGQTAHLATGETELDHPGVSLTTKQVWERYGDGDFSELLNHALRNPNDQCSFPIGIVWKIVDEQGHQQFWCAVLFSDGSYRELCVRQDHPDDPWFDDVRFLRGKSAGAKA